MFVLILAIIQNQALVASKHYLVETENENLAENSVDPPVVDIGTPPVDISTKSGETDGDDYTIGSWCC